MLHPLLRRAFQRVNRAYSVRARVTLGRRVHIGVGSTLWAPTRLTLGDHVYIGKRCTVECDGRIGRYVMLANNVGLVGRYDHDYQRVGTPMYFAPWVGDPRYSGPGTGVELVIEDDVWVGYGAIVLSGITVGRGAIVAAGSVVTHDVAPYAIVAGNPARQVGRRFTEAEARAHEALIDAPGYVPDAELGIGGRRSAAGSDADGEFPAPRPRAVALER